MGGFDHYSMFAFLLAAIVNLSGLPPSNRHRSGVELWSVPSLLFFPGPTKISQLSYQEHCWDSWSSVNLQEDLWHVAMSAHSLGAFLDAMCKLRFRG